MKRLRTKSSLRAQLESLETRRVLTTLVDIDADGDLDGVFQSQWFENDGSGNFTNHEFSDQTVQVSIPADVDGDGDADIVTSEPSWFENLGDGTLVRHEMPQPVANAIDTIVTADVGQDGTLDIVFFSGNQTTLATNTDGNGNFELGISGEFEGVVDADDFDADGDLDYLAIENGDLIVGTNNDGTYSREIVLPSTSELIDTEFVRERTYDARWSDIDLDGKLDFVTERSFQDNASGTSETKLTWINTQDLLSQQIEQETRMQTGCGLFIDGRFGDMATTDWNQDNAIDSWCFAPSDLSPATLAVTVNDRAGGFAHAYDISVPGGELDFELRDFTDAGDLNLDGIPDYITSEFKDGIVQWLDGAKGTTYVQPEVVVFPDSANVSDEVRNDDDIDLVDVDGDGDLEAIIAGSQTLEVWQIDSTGDDVQWSLADSISVDGIIYVDTGDVDADGDVDVVAASRNANRVLLNDGTGKFVDSGQSLGDEFTIDVALGDLDFDGDLDIFAANFGSAPNRVWLNDGAGAFSDSGARLGLNTSKSVELADIDRDGDLDAVVGNMHDDNGALAYNRIYWNDGNANFTEFDEVGGDRDTQHIAVADLNDDGLLDLFAVNSESNNATDEVFIQTTLRGRLSWDQLALGSGGPGSHVAIGDVDNDGDFDAVVANWSQTENRVWLNDGNGGFSTTADSLGSDTSSHVALGDIDKDGDLDAVFANYGQNVVHLNPLDPAVPSEPLLPPDNVPSLDDHAGNLEQATRIDTPTGSEVVTVSATGNFTGDVDSFEFRPSVDERYYVRASSGIVDVFINGQSRSEQELFTATVPGSMISIQVSGFVGQYDLQVSRAPYDHGTGLSTATDVEIGATVAATFAGADDVDYFRFDAEAGESYSIELDHISVDGSRVGLKSNVRSAGFRSDGLVHRIAYTHSGESDSVWLTIEQCTRCTGDGEYTLSVVLSDGERIAGDSNNDGRFDSADFVFVFTAGEYDDGVENNSTFATGDWNGDGEFDSGDLVFAFSEGTFQRT